MTKCNHLFDKNNLRESQTLISLTLVAYLAIGVFGLKVEGLDDVDAYQAVLYAIRGQLTKLARGARCRWVIG